MWLQGQNWSWGSSEPDAGKMPFLIDDAVAISLQTLNGLI
jgi:hypothetical protein